MLDKAIAQLTVRDVLGVAALLFMADWTSKRYQKSKEPK
jgi:hypothetical protein